MRKTGVSHSGYGFHLHSVVPLGSIRTEFGMVAESMTPSRAISPPAGNNILVGGNGPVEQSVSHCYQNELARCMSHVF